MVPFEQTAQWGLDYLRHPFMFPWQTIMSICSITSVFRDCLEGRWDNSAFREMWRGLNILMRVPNNQENQTFMQCQLWRLQDLRDGRGLGFTIELFFITTKHLLTNNSFNNALYIGTFRAITSTWRGYTPSAEGTQNTILSLATSESGILGNYDFPSYITDEF